MPALPSSRQIGVPARLAALSTCWGPRLGLVEKLKIPCPAGFRPVRNDDQAVGVTAGIVDRRRPKTPLSRQASERGQPAVRDQLPDEVVIGPVEPEAEEPHA